MSVQAFIRLGDLICVSDDLFRGEEVPQSSDYEEWKYNRSKDADKLILMGPMVAEAMKKAEQDTSCLHKVLYIAQRRHLNFEVAWVDLRSQLLAMLDKGEGRSVADIVLSVKNKKITKQYTHLDRAKEIAGEIGEEAWKQFSLEHDINSEKIEYFKKLSKTISVNRAPQWLESQK
jgi:hypothetical protein